VLIHPSDRNDTASGKVNAICRGVYFIMSRGKKLEGGGRVTSCH
jgi:hypothetical protein